ELRSHLAIAADATARNGGARAAALRTAQIEAGGVAQTLEALRDQRGLPWLETVFADFRYALRVMSRTPSFAVAVLSVLALGIGATTTIFSIVNAVLLRPLPFEEPDRLVRIFTLTTGPGGGPFDLSPGKFYD